MPTELDPTLASLARGLPRTALDALYGALARLPAERAARGRVLAAAASPAAVDADSRGVRANVSDGHQYVTRWAWSDDGASSLCSCTTGRACEHAFALGIWLLAAARRAGRWDHAHWGRLAPSSLAAEPVGRAHGAAHGAATSARHEHAVEALAQWADRGQNAPRRLRAVLHLDPAVEAGGDARAVLTLEARVTGPGLKDAPRTWRQLEQLAGELKRHPRVLTPPEARLLRALTAPEFAATYVPGDTRIELTSERIQALVDRVPESPHFTWSDDIQPALAARAGVEAGGRASLQTDEVRIVPLCDTSVEPPRLELSLEWPDGATRPLAEAVLLSPLGLTAGGRTHVSLVGGRFVRIVDEPPREVLKLLQEGGLELRRNDGAVLEKLSRSFPVVRSALHRLTRVHDVDVLGSFELASDDWLRVRVFAAARAAGWAPGVVPPEGAVFEYLPALGWMRLEPGQHVRSDLEAVGEAEPADATAGESAAPAPDGDGGAPDGSGEAPDTPPPAEPEAIAPEHAWFELPDPEHVAPIVEWVESLPQGDHSGRRKRGGRAAHVPVGAPAGWWLRLTSHVLEALADAWSVRPHGVRWYADAGASGLFRTRHAVARVKLALTGVDWFTVSAEWQAEGLSLREEDLSLLRASRSPFVKLSSGWVRRADLEEFDETAKRLADLGLEAGAGDVRVPLWQLAQADPASLDALESFGASAADLEAVRALRERLAAFNGLPRVPLPAGLHAEMRPYQHDGLDFLAWTASIGLGAVLADDMGLGKTLQALAWLAHMSERDPGGGPSLVVCPASVMHHWAREAARFTPGLRVLVLESGPERAGHRENVTSHDMVITNYALLRQDIAFWRGLELRAVILDEAQQIKNPSAAVTRAAGELKARYRAALTGTPLENRALDLWSIVNFIHPGFLGNRASFSARFDQPEAPPHRRRLLASRLRPLLLRRLKQQVAQELPPRVEERVDCQLTPGQRRFYLAELGRARAFLGTLLSDAQGLERNRMPVLATLTRLRQICCHPTLAGGRDGLGSGKFDELFELLEPLLAEGHKVLLFSQFVECLKLIEAEFERRSVPYHMLTGQTTRREKVVSAFTEDPRPCVFLLSLRAGGLGLNLTAASYVILFDPWWNPAIEAQAIDRTHRIGQTRTVIAYRLLTEGTVEERIWELQQRKSALAKDLLGEESFARSLSRADLEWLLSTPTDTERT
ncbi:MAG TPA: DEAD/DEAH box helicase [Methylomirabilota bacterium]|nr:DEAD/DEAH box helicase [Methylomirabilota bacterium]